MGSQMTCDDFEICNIQVSSVLCISCGNPLMSFDTACQHQPIRKEHTHITKYMEPSVFVDFVDYIFFYLKNIYI